MSDIKTTVNDDIKTAMKARDKVRLNVLRYIKKLFIENDTAAKQVAEMDIVISYAKKIKDSLAMYPAGTPQHEDILAEIEVLADYLPKQMSDEEVAKIIDTIKSSLEAPNMGAVMKELSPQIKGKFDGKKASQMVIAALK